MNKDNNSAILKISAKLPKIFITLSSLAAVFLFFAFLSWFYRAVEDSGTPQELKLIVDIEKVLDSHEVPDKNGNTIVQYAYQTDKKIEQKENEVFRDHSSVTELVKTHEDGMYTYKLTSYSGANFAESNGDWYQIEQATTTKEVFSRAAKPTLLGRLLGKKAWADTATIYSGAGDGYVALASTNSWAEAHDAASGSGNDETTANTIFTRSRETTGSVQWIINRGVLPFDTSAIPAGAPITSATLNLFLYGKTNTDNDGDDWLNVIQTSQPSNSALENADYDLIGSAITNPVEGATRIDIGSITNSVYAVFTLNTIGETWIKRNGETSTCGSTAGYTCLGIREGHDAINSSIQNDTENGVNIRYSEYADTTSDPYLEIVYRSETAPTGIGNAGAQKTNIKGGLIIKGGVRFK